MAKARGCRAKECRRISCHMVEPSAGTGSFLKLLPSGSLADDVDPKCHGIQRVDFLKIEIESDREIVIIGNPPLGKNASMAARATAS